ncbi:uncharacterized protein LOC128219566 isoform X2 [Mya arenaria]|nr:uncharacterized protein LOC128219566 isoform X2 [Mya arenaria]
MTLPRSSIDRSCPVLGPQDVPSIVATHILSFLDWNEKINATYALPEWKLHLCTPASWPLVRYGGEAEENVYFTKERRANFLICLKVYGKFMRKIEVCFGHPLQRSGQQILTAVSNYCQILKYFRFCPAEPQQYTFPCDMAMKKGDVCAFINVLRSCETLQDVALLTPFISWSEPVEFGSNNILTELHQTSLAYKITELRLASASLTDHEGYLHVLKEFKNLTKLSVRREKVNDPILLMLVGNGLQEICLYQDEELALSDSRQLREDLWKNILEICPAFKVDLVLQYILVIRDSFVPNMPLRSLVLDDLVNIVTKGVMDHFIECYKHTLESFTYTNLYLENFESGDSRLPAALIAMAMACEKLTSIRYGFPLTSTSILLLVKSRKLQSLVIPAVEVSYEFDWPVSAIQQQWGEDVVLWLKANCFSEGKLEEAVSEVLGFKWKLEYSPPSAIVS